MWAVKSGRLFLVPVTDSASRTGSSVVKEGVDG